jgi:tRNA dimethylallyltransferase
MLQWHGDMGTSERALSDAEPPEEKPRVIVICGPTATGKTAAGIALARTLGAEIISADSMQVYRRMDIGTAKPTAAERAAVAHYLIDVVDPDEAFDAARYAALAREKVLALHRRGVVPLIVGGTGLYIKALLHGLFRSDACDPAVRRRLAAEAETGGILELHAQLTACDPETARRLHPNDTARILRALEVFEVTGRPISGFHREHRFAEAPFDSLKIGLHLDREALYERIECRVNAMLAAGLEDEVRDLLSAGYGPQLKSRQSIGYSHAAAWLAGRSGRDEGVRTLKRDTRRFAKRQMTWFRADAQIVWSRPDRMSEIGRLACSYLLQTAPDPSESPVVG